MKNINKLNPKPLMLFPKDVIRMTGFVRVSDI
jgi:hypothetical protein